MEKKKLDEETINKLKSTKQKQVDNGEIVLKDSPKPEAVEKQKDSKDTN